MNEVEKMGETIKKITLATLLDNGKLFIDNNEITNHQNDPYYYNPGKNTLIEFAHEAKLVRVISVWEEH